MDTYTGNITQTCFDRSFGISNLSKQSSNIKDNTFYYIAELTLSIFGCYDYSYQTNTYDFFENYEYDYYPPPTGIIGIAVASLIMAHVTSTSY